MSIRINAIAGLLKTKLKFKPIKLPIEKISLNTFNKMETPCTIPKDTDVLLGKLPTLNNFENFPKFMYFNRF